MLFLCLFFNIKSQNTNIDNLYTNDNSYLVLKNDTAKFYIWTKNCEKNVLYKGEGKYYIKDSSLYVETISSNKFGYSRFTDVGTYPLTDSLIIQVVEDNEKIIDSVFLSVKGRKYYSDEKLINGFINVNVGKIHNPKSIIVRAYNDSLYMGVLEVNFKQILSNKILIHISEGTTIKDKLVFFNVINKNGKTALEGPIVFVKHRRLKLLLFKIRNIYLKQWPWKYSKSKIISCCSINVSILYSTR